MTSIRTRLTVGLVVAVLIVSMLAGIVLLYVVRRRLTKDFDAALESETRAIAGMIAWDPKGFAEVNLAVDKTREFTPGHHADFFEAWDDRGQVVARSPSLADGDLSRPEDGTAWVVLPGGRTGRAVVLSFVPNIETDEVEHAAIPPRRVTLVVARGIETVRHTLAVITSGLAAGAAVMIFGGVMAVRLLVVRGLQPIEELAEQVAAIDAGHLSSRVDGAAPPELWPIVVRLNELLARLESAFAREHRFTSAAAHELRTPIAELRTLVDFALKWPESSVEKLREIRGLAVEMEALSAALLTLSRCESGQETASRQSVDAAESIRRAWTAVKHRADVRAIILDLEVHNPNVVGDPAMIDAIARNLIDNAVEYSPRDSSVLCRIDRGTLTISNLQHGLSDEDVAHLFEPFWRKGDHHDSVHRGLGLSLVGAYASAMSAIAHAELTDDGRFAIRITFDNSGEVAIGAADKPLQHAEIAGKSAYSAHHLLIIFAI